ncbi:diguanylate cyclase (GGDEF)-like protein [Paucibacter oligotrophus]|uniref:diguanylate cyclase n=1 Tax=Roseateles oligotrophus TaxID=1769250 RepID=A0A840L483_9BURK|nr:diguanylate cyclase (GGDEF)-like protein [Roseateles oligotrophus]
MSHSPHPQVNAELAAPEPDKALLSKPSRLHSIRLRMGLAVFLCCSLIVGLTDWLHLQHQLRQSNPRPPGLSQGVGSTIASLPAANQELVFEAPATGTLAEPVQWREHLPAMLARDIVLVMLLSGSLIWLLERLVMRPLRGLAEQTESLAEDGPSTLSPSTQLHELAGLSQTIQRAQRQWIQRAQQEQQRAEAFRAEAERQAAALHQAEQALAQRTQELDQLKRVDALTGLPNRREFDEALRREFKRAQRHRGRLALAVLDLDQFKNFNERYGQAAGDQALQRFAQLLSERFKRDTDLVARLGGEEFVALLPGFELEVSQNLLEQVSEELRALQIPHAGGVGEAQILTVSIGLAAYCPAEPYLSSQALMQAADEALYIAKHAGRDRLSRAASAPGRG